MARIIDMLKDFFSPDEVEVNLGLLKLKFTDKSKNDVKRFLSELRSRRVLFAGIHNELWLYVFPSLHELRDLFVQLAGQLTSKSSTEVRSLMHQLTDLVTSYLAEHEASYTRFMSGPEYPKLAAAHKERNWPELGNAAEDLVSLRNLILDIAKKLAKFAGEQDTSDFSAQDFQEAADWVRCARQRTFCSKCGFNMDFAYEGTCPSCHPESVPSELRDFIDGDYGKA